MPCWILVNGLSLSSFPPTSLLIVALCPSISFWHGSTDRAASSSKGSHTQSPSSSAFSIGFTFMTSAISRQSSTISPHFTPDSSLGHASSHIILSHCSFDSAHMVRNFIVFQSFLHGFQLLPGAELYIDCS